MRAIVIFFVGAIAFVGCTQAASIAPSVAPTAAPLAVGEFTSHGVAATIDARGQGSDVTGTMTVSDTGKTGKVDLECSHATDNGLLMIGGLVTESTFTEWFPKGHRVAVIFQPGSPVKAIWWIVLPGDAPLESCQAVFDVLLAEGTDLSEGLEPIQGTVDIRA